MTAVHLICYMNDYGDWAACSDEQEPLMTGYLNEVTCGRCKKTRCFRHRTTLGPKRLFADWRSEKWEATLADLAQAGEAGTAETGTGSVHEHAVLEEDAPNA